jgi:creatinine amidohydrolase
MPNARILYNMTVREVRAGLRETQTVLLPIGVVEQHGYHLPLSTDIHNAQEIAARASAETGCFVAPCVHYSFSGGTLPGTINITPQVFSLVVMDILRSLLAQGFRHVIILLGHGGTENVVAANDAALMFQRLSPTPPGVTISVVPFWKLSATYEGAWEERDFHSGRYETSLMMFWQPGLVQLEAAELDAPELAERMRIDPDAYLLHEKLVEDDFVISRDYQDPAMEVGVMGNFVGSTAEFGEIICSEAVAGLAEFIRKLESA